MEILEALAAWPGAQWLRGSSTAYLFANAAHVMAIGLLFGAVATVDLRLLGAFRAAPVAVLAPVLSRVAELGAVLALATGFLLFSVRPAGYLGNPAFLWKLGLVALALLNAVVLTTSRRWREITTGGAPIITARMRVAAATSLALWAGAIVAGRWIGFV